MKPIPLKDQLMKIDAVRAADDVVSKVVRRDSVPEVETDFEVSSDRILAEAEESAAGMNGFYVRMAQAEHPETLREEAIGQARSYRRAAVNLSRSAVRSAAIADEVSSRYNDLTKSKRKRRLPVIGRAPANAFIDLEEANSSHFARGLNIYKLLLILYIGSFAGVVVELGWCLLKHGYIESRAGLVYGPFNLLYGVGAVAIPTGILSAGFVEHYSRMQRSVEAAEYKNSSAVILADKASPYAGRRVKEIEEMNAVCVTALIRGELVIVPEDTVRIEEGDVLLVTKL